LIEEKIGWKPTQPLRVGLEKTYRWIESELIGIEGKRCVIKTGNYI
jgi:hypothetical protein